MSNSKYQEALDRTKEIYEVICDELKSKELTSKTNEDVEVLQELVDKAKELSDSNDELRRQLYFIEPYKLEDLKEDMWVYDIKYDEFCRIDFIAGIYPHRSYSDGTCEDGAFEENRFFPVQCANYLGGI